MSALEAGPAVAAARLGRLQTERDAADTAAAMATLSMHHAASTSTLPMQSVSLCCLVFWGTKRVDRR